MPRTGYAIGILLIFVMLIIITTGPCQAAVSVNLEELNQQVQRLQAQKDNYDYLKQEITDYRRFLEIQQKEYREALERLVTNLFTMVVILISIFSAIFAFFNIKTWKNARQVIEKIYNDKILRLWHEKSGELTLTIEQLRRIVERETMYKRADVLVLVEDKDLPIAKEDIERPLLIREVHGIRLTNNIDGEIDNIKKGKYETIVRIYNKKANEGIDPIVGQVTALLRSINSHIAFIVYSPDRMAEADIKLIGQYRYAVPANFSITLIDYIITSISIIKEELED